MSTATDSLPDDGYEIRPEDKPIFPGAPYSFPHPTLRRFGYGVIGLWIAATASFANALVSVNVTNLAGEHDAYVAELSWFPAIYVAANSCANMMLVKARAQFSMPNVMRVLLTVYIAAAAMQFFVSGFASEAVVRFMSGLVAGGMTTTGIYYLMQASPAKIKPLAFIAGLGLTQLGTPLARMLPVDLLTMDGWLGQHCVEFAAGLTTLTLITLLPLPPTPRLRSFQPLDFVTFAFLLPAMLLICGVINRGRLGWWTDTPWLGVDLAIAIPLLATAIAIEIGRERPLIQIGWIGTQEFFGFAATALLIRLALAEQTYGAVGLLTFGNLDNDQLRELFVWVAVSMIVGILASVLTFSERSPPKQVIVASLAIAAGAWMDSHANNLTRPEQLYLSQSLIGFGTSMFIGPTLAHGILKVMRRGTHYFVTLVVIFSMTQNVGGLVGSAMLGTYQTVAARAHFQELAERIPAGDIQAANRVAASTRSLAGTITDPVVRAQQGGASLVASLAREATVRAYNDVFQLVWQLALATALMVALLMFIAAFRPARRTQPA